MRTSLAEKIKENDWFIVTKTGCGYCKKAKALLREKKVTFKTYNATSDKVFEKTDKMTKGYHYFPMIFKKGKFVGGYTELEKRKRF